MTTYNCKTKGCKYACRSIAKMAQHYRKKHPNRMKRRKSTKKARVNVRKGRGKYCSECGSRL